MWTLTRSDDMRTRWLRILVMSLVSVVASGRGAGTSGLATTPLLDTTGATAITAVVGFPIAVPILTDTKGNVWDLAVSCGNDDADHQTYVARDPVIVGPNHSFSATGFAPSICVIAFRGITNIVVGNSADAVAHSASSLQPGSVTPGSPLSLLIAGFSTNNNTENEDASIDSGFTKEANAPAKASVRVGSAIAWKELSSASAQNPTWSQPGSSAIGASLVELTGLVASDGGFTLPAAQAGLIGPLVKIRVTNTITDETYVASTQWIQDPATYWGGFAEASLLRIDDVRYAASDRAGPLQITSLRFEMSDVADGDLDTPMFRSWLGQIEKRQLRQCEIWMQMITDTARRQLLTPVTVFRGYIEEYEGAGEFRMIFDCLHEIHRKKDRPVLPHRIGDLFPNALKSTRDQKLPLALGLLSDEGSDEAPPVFVTDEAGRGGNGGAEPVNSFGDMAGGVPAPTGLSGVYVAGAGNLQHDAGGLEEGSAWNNEWVIQVVRRRSGVRSDPMPFIPGATVVTISADNAAIDCTCASDGIGGDVYEFYLGTQAVGGGDPTFTHYLETTTPTVAVRFTEKGDNGVFSTGGKAAQNPRYWSAALWVFPDGRTEPAHINAGNIPLAFIRSPGYKRPVRFAFDPPPAGALYGEIYLSELPDALQISKRFTISITDLNSNSDVYWQWDLTSVTYQEVDGIPQPEGVVPAVHAGKFTDLGGFDDWDLFIVSGRPGTFLSARIGGVLIDPGQYGVDILAPGQTGWSTSVNASDDFLVVGSFRVFAVMLRGPLRDAALNIASEGNPYVEAGQTGAEFRVNCGGIETNGDGSGTTITDGYDLIQIVLNQLGLPTVPTLEQPFNQAPAFSDATPKVDAAAFELAKADAAVVLPSGPSMARWIATSITVGELLAEWALSARARVYTPESGQLGAAVTNPDGDPGETIVEDEEVILASFRFQDRIQGYANIVPYRFNPRYDASGSWTFPETGEEESPSAQDESNETPSLPASDFVWLRSSGLARENAVSILRESEFLPRLVDSQSVLHWFSKAPLGQRVSITHREGPQAGGWIAHAVQVLGKTLSPTGFTIGITCLDLRRNVGDLTLFEVENLMATEHAGGSRIDSCMSEGGVTVFPNWIPITVDWSAIPSTHGKRLRAYLATDAGTIAARAYVLGDTITAIATTPTHNTTTLTEKEIQIPRTTGVVRYWILPVLAGGATAGGSKGICYVETYQL